jgi:hypothetical protein
MPKNKKAIETLAKIEENLFKDKENFKTQMSDKEYQIMLRYQQTFVYWNEHPEKTNRQIIDYLTDTFGVGRSQAYNDLPIIQRLLGNVNESNKAWTRHRLSELALQGYQKSLAAENLVAAAIFLEKLGKYNKLDQNDEDGIDWKSLPVQEMEPTGDIRVLSENLYNKDIESIRAKVRARYKNNIQDVDYKEVNDAEV